MQSPLTESIAASRLTHVMLKKQELPFELVAKSGSEHVQLLIAGSAPASVMYAMLSTRPPQDAMAPEMMLGRRVTTALATTALTCVAS
jgi:hypothetical protein